MNRGRELLAAALALLAVYSCAYPEYHRISSDDGAGQAGQSRDGTTAGHSGSSGESGSSSDDGGASGSSGSDPGASGHGTSNGGQAGPSTETGGTSSSGGGLVVIPSGGVPVGPVAGSANGDAGSAATGNGPQAIGGTSSSGGADFNPGGNAFTLGGSAGNPFAVGGAGGSAPPIFGGSNSGGSNSGGQADTCISCGGTAPSYCEPAIPKSSVLLDFDDGTGINGDFSSFTAAVLSYPATVEPNACDSVGSYPEYPMDPDYSGGNLHLAGTVTPDLALFGLYFGPCGVVDLSSYSGISFQIWGNAGPDGYLTLSVGTAPTTAPFEGQCTINSATCLGSACWSSSAEVEVTSTPTTVSLLWSDFTSGSPNDTPDSSQVTSLIWLFGYTSDSYPVDMHVDDIKLTGVAVAVAPPRLPGP